MKVPRVRISSGLPAILTLHEIYGSADECRYCTVKWTATTASHILNLFAIYEYVPILLYAV
jgi:hypothetical protein